MTRLLRALILCLAVAAAAHAQGPSADWRTIETRHFRIFFPAEYRTWAERAASRVESMRSAIINEVGFDSPARVDVIVSNPLAVANGAALPLLGAPRIIFFTEPPAPDEQIGAYSDWIDLLAVHEITHVMHMLRPSRNPAERAIERLALPLGPITLNAPRWVLEGYATVVEGRLTGAGRPASSLRATILRKWASSGRMPAYAQLNSDNRFLGLSMAYLAGSAYLEWLDARAGGGSLRRLWARMTARHRRSFSEAFAGVYGDTPQQLYERFVAELTASAMTVNRATELREGELWQETPRGSGDPAVSPDGSQIAVVIRERNEPQRLVIWSTAAPIEETKKYEKQIADILKKDPEDYAPVRAKPLPRKAVKTFTLEDGGDISGPRWTPDGKTIVFSHRVPDREGFLHRDLFAWTPSTGASRRITNLADVFDADPMPDGRSAIAVRSRYGLSQLVTVDLASGNVTPMNEPSLDAVYSHPRATQGHIAYVAHRNGVWTLFVDDKPIVADVNVASPEWQGDTLVATILAGGFAELHRIALDGTHAPVTRSSGGAFEPAPSKDGRVFFMGLEPDGFVVRTITPSATPAPIPPYSAALVPALPPVIPSPAPFAAQPAPPSKPYGIGPQESDTLAGGGTAPHQNAIEVGLRVGDIIGRLDLLAIASLAHGNGQRGGTIGGAWRRWPIALSAQLFKANDQLVKRQGGELRASWQGEWPLTVAAVEAGVLAGNPTHLGFAQFAVQQRQAIGSSRIEEEVQLSGESGSLHHDRGVLRGAAKAGSFGIDLRYQHDNEANIGGLESSIVPRSAIPDRVYDPALPVNTVAGHRYDGARIELNLPGLPLNPFYQVHRAGGTRLSLAGLEATIDSPPVPIVRAPAFLLTLGIAHVFDEPYRGKTNFWVGLRWRP